MTVNKIYILVINWYFNSSQMESYHAHSTLHDEKQPSVISVIRIHIGVFWGIISKDPPASPFSKPFYNMYNENGFAVV